MPTYQYECQKCGSQFEHFQSISSPSLTECPMESNESSDGKCGGPVKRLISGGAGFLFRGSGFYITDYRSEAYKEKAKKESEASSGGSESKGSDSSQGQSGGSQGQSSGSESSAGSSAAKGSDSGGKSE